jgi:hypothetical protein
MTKVICPECNGECLTCDAGFMEEISPEDYNTSETDQFILKGVKENDLIYR